MRRLLGWCALLTLLLFTPAPGYGEGARGSPVAPEVCATCHDAVAQQFQHSVHARLAEHETRGKKDLRGCQACHGAGSAHAESADPEKIFSFKKAEARAATAVCLDCHRDHTGADWASSEHALAGMSCNDCHRIHQSRRSFAVGQQALPGLRMIHENAPPPRYSLNKPEPQLCLECHKDMTARMMMTSRHPVREGKMKCSSCHQPHGSPIRQLRTEERVNDLCLKCHTAKQGPFVFEHPPVVENCLTCHEPHGTVANNLLRQNEPFLCLQCHEAHFHVGRSGQTGTLTLPSGGSTNPYGERGWRTAFGTKCSQCHSQIHGSDLPGQSVPGRGRSLIR